MMKTKQLPIGTHYSLAYSLLEQDVIGGLPCVAYSTSSSPWEAEYCSLWDTQHAI